MAEEKVKCAFCGERENPTLSKSGPHIKVECDNCGKFIKFVRKSKHFENKLAEQKAKGTPQQDAKLF